jgi:hypothetical protein
MKYFLGAYSTAPATESWDPALQAEYFAQIKTLPNLAGLELPFTGSLHAHDDEWLLAQIDPQWDYVFTAMPGVMDNLSKNPEFGIASDVESGRQAALAFYQQAQQAVLKLSGHLQRQAVRFVQLHSSPARLTASSSSAKALQASLETMQSWDWQGARLVIEHCDTLVEGQDPAKGFLSLDEEIAAINAVNQAVAGDIGLAINWGRSALETRSIEGPIEHVKKAREARLLLGLMFSGASSEESSYGVWKDSHMPPAQAFGGSHYASNSLLTAEQFERCLAASDYKKLGYLGVKIAAKPATLSVAERVGFNRDALAILDKLTG